MGVNDRTWPSTDRYLIKWRHPYRGTNWVDQSKVSRPGQYNPDSSWLQSAEEAVQVAADQYSEDGVRQTMSTFVEESSEVLQEQWNEIYSSIDAQHLEILSLVWKLGSSVAMFIPGVQPGAAASIKASASADIAAFLINVAATG